MLMAVASPAGIGPSRLFRAELGLSFDGPRIEMERPEATLAALRRAAAMGVPRAFFFLGELTAQGKMPGGARYAVALFEQGWAWGDPDCAAHLVMLYQMGRGIDEDDPKRNPEALRELARQSTIGGSPLGTYLYAEYLDKGLGKPNARVSRSTRSHAQALYRQSAQDGNALAKRWCREHDVPY